MVVYCLTRQCTSTVGQKTGSTLVCGASSCLLLLWRAATICRHGRVVFIDVKGEVSLMEGPEIKFAEAVLDNGKYGKRTVRFETGRLAQQAQGAVAAYLDEETMLLSATSASKQPREGFDFFPLTVDVKSAPMPLAKSQVRSSDARGAPRPTPSWCVV